MLLRYGHQLLDLSKPIVMGILNCTPDSFYDGGRWASKDTILKHTNQMITEGARIIDVGGVSTKPYAQTVSQTEEIERILPVIEALKNNFGELILSVDTSRAAVARLALEAGADMVNDVSAGAWDADLHKVVADKKAPYVLMHAQGRPENMQDNPNYENPTQEILDFFIQQTAELRTKNIQELILDIGFGFGKTLQQNYQLLRDLSVFKILNLPILVGISRKSMIYKPLQTTPQEALHGTTALHFWALQQGANILRVHDVRPAMDAIRMWECLQL